MAKWCMIDPDTREVLNICEWDGLIETWTPPGDVTMVLAKDDTGRTDIHDDKTNEFIKVDPVEKPVEKTEVEKLRELLIQKGVISADDFDTSRVL